MERKLCLSLRDKKIAGVCGGFAEYFHLDSSLIRIGLVLLTLLLRGSPVIAYLICWAVIPVEQY